MKKIIPILLIVLILSACFGSQTAKRYFQLQLANNTFRATKKLAKIIMLDTVRVKQLYDDFRIIYRISPYEINYYSYDFWAKKPGKLIFDTIVDYLYITKIFIRVDEKLSLPEPDLLMKVTLNSIEEVDIGNVWYARLSMMVEILHFKSGEVILNASFDSKKRLPSRKVVHLPRALSIILQEELKKIMDMLIKKIDQTKQINIQK